MQPESSISIRSDNHARRHWMVFAILIGALVGCAGVAAFILSQRSILLTSKADATDVDSSFEAAGTSISNIDRSLWGSQFQGYNCTDERWNHQTRMYQNTFLCSTSNSYVWGVSKKGNLVWKDLSTGEKKVYYRNVNKQKLIYFWLTLDGKFQMIGDNGEILWQKNPGNYNDIGYHQCLANYACPYLHLHPDGVIVLNWIDATSGSWITKNINKLYGV